MLAQARHQGGQEIEREVEAEVRGGQRRVVVGDLAAQVALAA